MSYQIKLDLSKASLTLRLFETVDLSETSEIKEALTNEPKAGADKLIVDGGHIDYLDSSAVALLLFSKRVAADNGMTCEFLPFSEEAFKVINMAGLQSTFKAKKLNPHRQKPVLRRRHQSFPAMIQRIWRGALTWMILIPAN